MALSRERLDRALAVSAYMLGEARLATDADVVIAQLGELLGEAGIPIDRIVSIVQLLNAEAQASASLLGAGQRRKAFSVCRLRRDRH
jgi:hypothetical protein